jgi:hypothetical protein
LLVEFLPKIKRKLGTGTAYLAALLQTRLLGLRDNLGGVLIRDDDGPLYNPTQGESSRFDWYNKKTGRLYISHFKTAGTAQGKPYDFKLQADLKAEVDATLAPGHKEASRKYLVGVGVDAKTGLPAKAGPKIMKAFMDAGLKYNMIYKGKLTETSAKPLDIRHSQIVLMHRTASQSNPSLTPAQISEKIAGYFQHSNDINQGYLRRTFDSLDDPLARKGGALPTISENEAGPSRRAPEPKKKPAAKKQTAPKPAAKKAAAPEAPTPKPAPPPPVIVTGTRRSARGRVPSRRLDLT